MNRNRNPLIALCLFAVGLVAIACQGAAVEAETAADAGVAATASEAAAVQPGGARLWEQTCARCHNYRKPRSRTDAEWELIVHHMRVRANIPAADAREILRFLQAAN